MKRIICIAKYLGKGSCTFSIVQIMIANACKKWCFCLLDHIEKYPEIIFSAIWNYIADVEGKNVVTGINIIKNLFKDRIPIMGITHNCETKTI